MKDTVFALRFLGELSWRTDRRRLLRGGTLMLLGFLATPLLAVVLRAMVNAVIDHRVDAAVWLALAAATTVMGELMLGHFGHLSYFELGELNEERLNRDLLRLISSSRRLEEVDAPHVADQIDLLRQDLATMRQTVDAWLRLGGLVVQITLTAVILGMVQPVLLLLLPIAAVPVAARRSAERIRDAGRERAVPIERQIRQLRALVSDPGSQKEIRLSGSADHLVKRHDELQRRLSRVLGRAELRCAGVTAAGQLVFAASFMASIWMVYHLASQQRASIGDIVLFIVLAAQVSTQVALGSELLGLVNTAGSAFRRFAALRRTMGPPAAGRPLALTTLTTGITLEDVGFTYPGSGRTAVRGISVHLPPGRTVAIVGENGAGKSTLIRLLHGLYRPTRGRILVDGHDICDVDAGSWHDRTAVLFQDFARFEFSLRESVGVGRVEHIERRPDVLAAIRRARATPVLNRVGGDLERLLGNGYGKGTDLSGGQWQSVGFARAVMRTAPLLVSLDEPGHSLDALTEQQVVDAYQDYAREVATRIGGVTIFVTHRLSTVRLADIILVLVDGRLAEVGGHDQLMRAGGRYAELFTLQARAYRHVEDPEPGAST